LLTIDAEVKLIRRVDLLLTYKTPPLWGRQVSIVASQVMACLFARRTTYATEPEEFLIHEGAFQVTSGLHKLDASNGGVPERYDRLFCQRTQCVHPELSFGRY